MHRFTRALGVLVATTVATAGFTVIVSPTAQARPAESSFLDLPLPPPNELPKLSGVPGVGQLLSVSQPVWNVLPGALSTDITWLCNGSPIPGTQGIWSFVPTDAQQGCAITASVVTTVAGFLPLEMITNALQIPSVVGGDDEAVKAVGAPTVTAGAGGAKVGTPLTTSAPDWEQEDVATTYQWLRAGQPISGATGTSYLLAADDLDQPISVRATGRKGGLTDGTVTSNAVTATIGDAPTPTIQPTISGPGAVGRALSVEPGTWGAGATPTYAYQWRRDNAAIEGATTSGYTPTVEDVGHVLTVTVTATRPGHRPGTFRTSGVSVPKLVSVLSASLSRKKIKQTQRAAMTLVLSVPGLDRPAGTLTILDGRRTLTTVVLTPAKAGKVTISLRGLKPGVHRLKATYAGSVLATGSASKVVKLTVTKTKKKSSR